MIQAKFGLNWPSGFRGEDFWKSPLIKTEFWHGGKNDQHSMIYLPCNFEINLITRIGVIALFSSIFFNFNTFRLIFQKL
jgi:hypothetical protein